MSTLTPVMRGATEEDIPLILDSWIKQIRRCKPLSDLSADEFNKLHRPVMYALIQNCGIKIACSPTDPLIVYGYIIGEILPQGQFLHMLYVRSAYRCQGVATSLLKETFKDVGTKRIYVTHMTKAHRYHIDRWCLSYYPYAG